MPLVAVLIGYLLGSVLPADLIARSRGLDIRALGSGNPGSTNARETLGASAGLVTAAFDIFKGLAAMGIAALMGVPTVWIYAAGFAAVVGHRLPVWSRFRGGEGTATTTGLMLYLLGVAIEGGWVTAAEVAGVTAVALLAFALFRNGTMVGFTFLPLALGAVITGAPDLAFVAFASLLATAEWLQQASNARRDNMFHVDPRARQRLERARHDR